METDKTERPEWPVPLSEPSLTTAHPLPAPTCWPPGGTRTSPRRGGRESTRRNTIPSGATGWTIGRTPSSLPEHVAHAPHRMDEPGLAAVFQLLTQIGHIHFQDVGFSFVIVAPHLFHQIVPGQHLFRMRHKALQQ